MASIANILSSVFGFSSPSAPSPAQKVKQEFAQLGQDLKAGDLKAAQSDFATLQQDRQARFAASSAGTSTNSGQSASPIAQDFTQLSTDLKAGNLTAAQGDYTAIVQAFQNQAQGAGLTGGHHHHHRGGGDSSASSTPVNQLFAQLGQALQSGNLPTAQQAYATLQQDFQQTNASSSSSTAQAASATTGVSVSA